MVSCNYQDIEWHENECLVRKNNTGKVKNSDNKTPSLFLSFYEKFNPDALHDKRRAKVKITSKKMTLTPTKLWNEKQVIRKF